MKVSISTLLLREDIRRIHYSRRFLSPQRTIITLRIIIDSRSVQEIIISEAHSLLAHLGASKTIDYLRDHVWWKDMVADTKSFCESCHVCKLSKPDNTKSYVPCKTTYTARQVAELMFEHVYKLHGLPKRIISDRDSLFTSIFWKRLHELIGVNLHMSNASAMCFSHSEGLGLKIACYRVCY
ncbi:ribonuclease H-like partial [Lentinula edodes]|uniref:Ribonuclease H-like partial n=1 Tax=Lentinula edodes TaxID=5353 RepID=A0A1Q3ES51_LENED|nr:ribonuclease H-like partial [Lentinula edodes]